MIDREPGKAAPCPHCGVDVEKSAPLWKHKTRLQCVRCIACDLHGPMARGRPAAVAAWNRVAGLFARAEKAERERDAIIRLCYVNSGKYYGTEAEAIAAIRKAAGLDSDPATTGKDGEK